MYIPSVSTNRTFKFARAEYYQPFIYVGEGGDLTLNLQDAPRLDELAEGGLIEQWAEEAGFLLEGPDFLDEELLNTIDEREALQHIWTQLVLPACAELLEDAVDVRTVAELMRGETPKYIADVYVGVDPYAAAVSLLHKFDGPFSSPEAFDLAAVRRMGATETPSAGNWDRP